MGDSVNIQKIIGLAGLAVVVIGAFVSIPEAEAILLVIGLYLGFGVAADIQVRVLVSALVLNTLVHTFDSIPAIGHYLVTILGNLGLLLAGIAVMICLRNVYARVVS